MNPWTSIWFHPRQTIRQIVDTNPRNFVLPLAIATGVANTLIQIGQSRVPIPLPIAIGIAGILGGIFGVIGLYFFGWLYRWVGSWFGGKANAVEVRAAIAWVEVPSLVVLAVWIAVLVISLGQGNGPEDWPTVLTVGLVSLAVIAWIWRVVLACHTLGEVHRFSTWKGLGTLLVPNVLLTLPIFFIAMIAAIAIPNFVRARTTANESAAVGNLRALGASLEAYRSVNAHYPQTSDWGIALSPVGTQSYAPASFRTSGSLTDYDQRGYSFTYTSTYTSDTSDGPGEYAITATPIKLHTSGTRGFYLDDTGVIRHCTANAQEQHAKLTDRSIDEEPGPC